MNSLEKAPSFESSSKDADSEKEELDGLLEQYNGIVNRYEQLPIINSETDGAAFDCTHSNPTQYIEIYAKIGEQTPLAEARAKMDKIDKAIAIDQIMAENKSYTDEEIRKIGAELADFFHQNEDQYDVISGRLNESDVFPDGRFAWGYFHSDDRMQAFDNTELFWNLKNDNMSIESWAYVCKYGFKDANDPVDIAFKKELPVFSDYMHDLLKRQAEERDRKWRQEVEEYERKQRQETEEHRATRPDIFAKPDEKIMQSNMKPFLKRVNMATLREIMKEHGNDFEVCCGEMVRYLSLILELKELPDIIYEPEADDGTLGSYSRFSNTITIHHAENGNKNMTLNDINTIAHEMWHAYQHQVADEEDEGLSPELYRKNFQDYVTAEEDYHGYRIQLVETEARMFAEQFTERSTTRLERLKAKKIGRKIMLVAALVSASANITAITLRSKGSSYRRPPDRMAIINSSHIDSNGSELDTPTPIPENSLFKNDVADGEFDIDEYDNKQHPQESNRSNDSIDSAQQLLREMEEPNNGTIPKPN